jgi:hypothetical protein
VLCPYGKATSGADAVCSGHGRCISLGDASNFVDYEQFFSAVAYTDWDADMIYGCDCDSGGYFHRSFAKHLPMLIFI